MTKTETFNGTIPNGEHFLSGFEEVTFDRYGEELDGVVIIVDGKYYLAYYDPDDGYRSYGKIREIADLSEINTKIINIFEPQKIMVYGFHEVVTDDEDDYITTDKSGIRLVNGFGDLILEVSTNYAEDYYPFGHIEYHPENLPCNLNKKSIN